MMVGLKTLSSSLLRLVQNNRNYKGDIYLQENYKLQETEKADIFNYGLTLLNEEQKEKYFLNY